MSYIGKRVRIIGNGIYDNHAGKTGTVVAENVHGWKHLWRVKMDDGVLLIPWAPTSTDKKPECELIKETVPDNMDQYKVKNLADKTAIHCSTEEEWNKILQVMEDNNINWAGGRKPSDRKYENHSTYGSTSCVSLSDNQLYYSPLSYYEEEGYTIITADQFIKANTETMTQEAPKTVTIKSDNPTLLKAFWEDIEKLGYTSNTAREPNRTWKFLCTTSSIKVKDKEQWESLYISGPGVREEIRGATYILPADYVAAYKHMKEGMEWWIEKEKAPVYKVGDWVTVINSSCCIEDQNEGDIIQITSILKHEYANGWRYGTTRGIISSSEPINTRIRPATPQEIKAAQCKVVEIGDANCRTKVTIKKGSITADGNAIIPITTIEGYINCMNEMLEYKLPWTIDVSITIAPSCSRKVTGVKVSELREILKKYNELNN